MKFKWLEKRNHISESITLEVEMPDDITDEIEKSLIELKEAYDLPTEEVEASINTRRESAHRSKLFKFRNIK